MERQADAVKDTKDSAQQAEVLSLNSIADKFKMKELDQGQSLSADNSLPGLDLHGMNSCPDQGGGEMKPDIQNEKPHDGGGGTKPDWHAEKQNHKDYDKMPSGSDFKKHKAIER